MLVRSTAQGRRFLLRHHWLLGALLALWLAPQWLLASHTHKADGTGATAKIFASCEICAQLATSTPAIHNIDLVLPLFAVDRAEFGYRTSLAVRLQFAIACRGPPHYLH